MMVRFIKSHAIKLIILMLVLIPVIVSAQGSEPTDDEVNAVAKQLYCPVCENVPLDACGTAACEQWRGIIRDKLAEGWTEEQIKAYFVEQYGDLVLAEPPRRGFNLLVYIVPLVAFIGGSYLLFRGFRIWKHQLPENRKAGSIPEKQDIPEDYIGKVERELEKRSSRS